MSRRGTKRGASRGVQRSLGWGAGDQSPAKVKNEAPCVACGQPLEFNVPDPLGIGRSMQRCSNRSCVDRHARPLVCVDPRHAHTTASPV
jgi:hypothetical protein